MPTPICPPPAQPRQAAPLALLLVWGAQWRLITHCVFDEAEWLFGKTATLIPISPQDHFLMFLLHHPLLNVPALSPTPYSPYPPLQWHRPPRHVHTPLRLPLQRCSHEKFIAGPDCYGQILIKCCFAAICLIGHRRDVLSTCRLCPHPPARLARRCSLVSGPCLPGWDH